MSDPLRAFIARFTALQDAANDDEVHAAGMEAWDASDSQGEVQQAGLIDQRARSAITSTTYPPQFVAPAGYPTEWPFLADTLAVHGRVIADDQEQHMMVWPELAEWRSHANALREFHQREGWHFHSLAPEAEWPDPGQASEGSNDAIHRVLGAFHRAASWRLLALHQAAEAMLILLQGRYEDFWP